MHFLNRNNEYLERNLKKNNHIYLTSSQMTNNKPNQGVGKHKQWNFNSSKNLKKSLEMLKHLMIRDWNIIVRHWPVMQVNCRSVPSLSHLQIQSHSFIHNLVKFWLKQRLLLSASIPRRLSRCWRNILSSLLWTFSVPPPSPSPLLGISLQYLETHFTWNLYWPQLLGFWKNVPPSKTQPAHSK